MHWKYAVCTRQSLAEPDPNLQHSLANALKNVMCTRQRLVEPSLAQFLIQENCATHLLLCFVSYVHCMWCLYDVTLRKKIVLEVKIPKKTSRNRCCCYPTFIGRLHNTAIWKVVELNHQETGVQPECWNVFNSVGLRREKQHWNSSSRYTRQLAENSWQSPTSQYIQRYTHVTLGF